MNRRLILSIFSSFLFVSAIWGSSIPFTGKLSDNGVNFHGTVRFAFKIVDINQTVHWSHDDQSESTIPVQVINGRYSVKLGGQGMQPLPSEIFLLKRKLFLRVSVNLKDGNGLQVLSPDQPIGSVPHSLTADLAAYSQRAGMAESMPNGSVTRKMLDSKIIQSLDANLSIPTGFITPKMLSDKVSAQINRTVNANQMAPNTITTAQLNEQILKYLKPEITQQPQAPGLIFNGQSVNLTSQAQGKFLTYQWQRNGQPILGATSKSFSISEVNGTLHDGNYTLVVSNDFGSVTSSPTSLLVDSTPSVHTVESISMEMIFCPPGTFTMGSPTTEMGRGGDETQYQVTLTNGFYLGKYEVTQAQYQIVMNGNSKGLSADPSQFKGGNRPVEKVSWADAQIFLTQLNAIEQTAGRLPEGWKYVLPTEAQWEYACRAGTTTAYSWGNDINASRANYNWDGHSNTGNDFKQTRDVGQYAVNPWGFFDMHGNVQEWVQDWRANYPSGDRTNPEGPASGSLRVQRGGSYYHEGKHLRSAERSNAVPGTRHSFMGFRVGFQPIHSDTANPELELFGEAGITREAGQAWAEPGVEAYDARDGNITDQIVVTGTVDMNSTGTYLLTYTVQDGGGNTATATRTVTVVGNRTVELNATVAMDMIWCPPGTFTMGSPTDEVGRENDETEHNVSLTQGFYLGKYEVTQSQYEAVMTGVTGDRNATPSNWYGNPNRPVEKVSWDDAQVFLTRLNEQHADNLPAGWSYVLPTESQWEYACRAGTTTAYSWGDGIASTNANYSSSGYWQTRDVGQYAANPWGFFDMHGNVREWAADWYHAVYPTGNPVVDPSGPATGSKRVIRGSSWNRDGTTQRSAKRYDYTQSSRGSFIGFRVGFKKSQ